MTTITRDDIRADYGQLYTLFDCIAAVKSVGITITPEQEFRLAAIFKKHSHCEKSELLKRIKLHFDHVIKTNENFEMFMKAKIETHDKFRKLSDEECVTFDIGSHIYKKTEEGKDEKINDNESGTKVVS